MRVVVLFQPLSQFISPDMKLINKSQQPIKPDISKQTYLYIIKDINTIMKKM